MKEGCCFFHLYFRSLFLNVFGSEAECLGLQKQALGVRSIETGLKFNDFSKLPRGNSRSWVPGPRTIEAKIPETASRVPETELGIRFISYS